MGGELITYMLRLYVKNEFMNSLSLSLSLSLSQVIFFFYCLSRNFTAPEIINQFFAHSRSSSRHGADGESAYKRDLFVCFLIPHLFPRLKKQLIPEKNLFNLNFYKSQKKN